ncbi:ComF family protein [Nitrosomonas supralitoralis]|uniref:Phosphoribosyltransferase n=1 Tax=Nitrosomonas supralitoralis TaxID=2116706 RepID=A0A2P7NX86_9PROT|nr:ComF family protein [Nitrosomonas supralitoralis]PSJ18045.1 phosphoribosyltransferase [Nitrosomonas supralitoralis]
MTQTNCILCGIPTNQDFCEPCILDLPQLPYNHCPVCLWPVPTSEICGACLNKPPAFTRTIATLRYAFPVDALIRALKYQANLSLASILGNLLIKKLKITNIIPDVIIPMPLHPIRLRERGFNQAMEISRHISKPMGIVVLPDSCTRIKHTPSQAGLPWKDRQKNIRNAFKCKIDLSGKHVALVDDVMTTGATLNELAQVLRQHGAIEISNWVIARALPE